MTSPTASFYVYVHHRIDNGQAFYVGKGFGRRAYEKSGRTKAWRTVFKAAGGFDVRFAAEGITDEAARLLETQMIAELENLVVNARDSDRRPLTPHPRKSVVVTLDPDLVEWLHQWRMAQPAEVPFGRALDACIKAFRDAQTGRLQESQRSTKNG